MGGGGGLITANCYSVSAHRVLISSSHPQSVRTAGVLGSQVRTRGSRSWLKVTLQGKWLSVDPSPGSLAPVYAEKHGGA